MVLLLLCLLYMQYYEQVHKFQVNVQFTDYSRALRTFDLSLVAIKKYIRGHSTTTWTEFCHFLTPSPPHLVHVVIECPLMFLHFCRPREIAGDPNCSGDASTSSLLPTESRDEIDVAELQSELLVLLCPTLGKESDEVRRQSLLGNGTGNVSTGTGNSIQQSV